MDCPLGCIPVGQLPSLTVYQPNHILSPGLSISAVVGITVLVMSIIFLLIGLAIWKWR